MSEPRHCRLCGSSWNVAPALIRWEQAERVELRRPGGVVDVVDVAFSWGIRCRDVEACRKRVELAGVEWLLA